MADCAIKDCVMQDSMMQDSAIKVGLGDLKYVCDAILGKIRGVESNIIFLLVGDIGAGKTTLVREFAGRIGSKDSVTSPTFNLLNIYSVCNSPLDLHSADLANRHKARTQSPLSLCPFTKNHESQTENPSVVDSAIPQNLGENAESHTQKNTESKIFCYFWLKPKVESSLPYRLKTTSDSTIPHNPSFSTIYHYDLFNRNLSELLDLGLLDLLGEDGIHFVEWGDSQLFSILKNAFENICIISIHKTKNDRIYEFKEHF